MYKNIDSRQVSIANEPKFKIFNCYPISMYILSISDKLSMIRGPNYLQHFLLNAINTVASNNNEKQYSVICMVGVTTIDFCLFFSSLPFFIKR